MIAMILQSIDLVNMDPGVAILYVGVMAILLWSVVQFRNPLGIVMWGLTLLMFAFSGLFEFGIEFVWIGIVLTTVLIVIGIAVRWSG